MLSLIKIKDVNQCENIDHVYVIFRTSPRATHMVRAGDLVSAGNMLVTTPVTRGSQGGKAPLQKFLSPLEKCVGHSLKILDT